MTRKKKMKKKSRQVWGIYILYVFRSAVRRTRVKSQTSITRYYAMRFFLNCRIYIHVCVCLSSVCVYRSLCSHVLYIIYLIKKKKNNNNINIIVSSRLWLIYMSWEVGNLQRYRGILFYI